MNEQYLALKTPSFAPPSWVFGPVWTILYIMMAIAAYRVFRLGWEMGEVRIALIMFGIQLFFNLIWTQLFFNWQLRGLALIDIILLLAVLILTTVKFFQLDHMAGYLLIPYILWVSFASLLNLSIWLMNR